MAFDANRKGFAVGDFTAFSNAMQSLNGKGNQQAAQPKPSPFTANLGNTNSPGFMQQEAIKGRDRAFGMAQDSQNFAKQQVWLDQGAKIRQEGDQRRMMDRQVTAQNQDMTRQKNNDRLSRQRDNHQFAVSSLLQREEGNRTERLQGNELASKERMTTESLATELAKQSRELNYKNKVFDFEKDFQNRTLDLDKDYKTGSLQNQRYTADKGVETAKYQSDNLLRQSEMDMATRKRQSQLAVFNSLFS